MHPQLRADHDRLLMNLLVVDPEPQALDQPLTGKTGQEDRCRPHCTVRCQLAQLAPQEEGAVQHEPVKYRPAG